jgi:hypothetical protein
MPGSRKGTGILILEMCKLFAGTMKIFQKENS